MGSGFRRKGLKGKKLILRGWIVPPRFHGDKVGGQPPIGASRLRHGAFPGVKVPSIVKPGASGFGRRTTSSPEDG